MSSATAQERSQSYSSTFLNNGTIHQILPLLESRKFSLRHDQLKPVLYLSSVHVTVPPDSAYLQAMVLQWFHNPEFPDAVHANINDVLSDLCMQFHDHIFHRQLKDDQYLNHVHESDGYDLKAAMHRQALHA